MSDPISGVALGLGAASLAIQIFSGCEKGYLYFMAAANMTEECKVVKVRLLIEFSRLVDWGEATGLSNDKRHAEYDARMKMNRDLVAAILGEIRLRLKSLTKFSLAYTDLKVKDKDLFGDEEDTNARPADVTLIETDGNINARSTTGRKSHRGLLKENIEDIVEYYENIFESPHNQQSNLKHPKGLNRIIRFSKGVQDVATNPKRFKWALKDKKQIEKDLLRLKELNDYLQQTVGENQIQMLLETTNATWLGMLQLTENISGLEKLLIAYQDDLRATRCLRTETLASDQSTLIGSEDGSFHTTQVSSDSAITTYEKLTKFTINATNSLATPVEALELNHSERQDVSNGESVDDGLRKWVMFRDTLVWIEWKYFEEVTISGVGGITEDVPDARVRRSVERLVSLLQITPRPDEFCVPNCLGYFLDRSNDRDDGIGRFGLMYEAIINGQSKARSTSLLSLLSGTRPSIQYRIRLANELARCLTYLHTVNWLHKGFRSANLLLFPDTSDDLGKICISGLEYARPDEPSLTQKPMEDDLAWGEYIHPGYLGHRRRDGYKRTYDIYSLGIILLEIAYWKPAAMILSGLTRTLGSLEKVQDRLLEDDPNILNQVKVDMGQKYYSAVRTCLVGMTDFGLREDLDQREPAVAALIQQAFSRGVVEVLGTIVL